MKRDQFNTLPPLAVQFLRRVEAHSQSTHTVMDYASDLRLFFRFLAEKAGIVASDAAWDEVDLSFIDLGFIKDITVDDAYAFRDYCERERGNNARTLARRTVAVKRFFHYLTAERHYLEQNPMEEFRAKKYGQELPVYLPLEECRALLNAVEGDYRDRDYCILILFLNCGMRLSELCGIDLKDVQRGESRLTITGKGNKQRTVYLNAACLAAIERYLRARPQDSVVQKDRDALFISRNNRRINQRSVELMLEKYLKLAGLDGRGYSVHKLRHTAATLMYQQDVDVLQLKEILGHENLSTTEIYTHVASKQLQEAVNKNPLSMEGVKQNSE